MGNEKSTYKNVHNTTNGEKNGELIDKIKNVLNTTNGEKKYITLWTVTKKEKSHLIFHAK